MKLLRSLAVYLYVAGKVVYGARYFEKLEKQKDVLGEAAVAQKVHDYAKKMAQNAFKLSGATFVLKGAENLPKEGAALYVANHQSYVDVAAVLSAIERPVGFVLKDDLEGIPFFDKWITHMQCVPIARGEARKALEAILKAAKLMKNGHDMMLFPEGTRSRKGNEMLEFHWGSFKCALKAKCPIVPIAFVDSFKVLDQKGIKPVKVQIHYLKPIPYEEYKDLKTNQIAALVRERIHEKINEVS
jgi:1-acyl-sn-glycerol-3-phosphate acyltransferase